MLSGIGKPGGIDAEVIAIDFTVSAEAAAVTTSIARAVAAGVHIATHNPDHQALFAVVPGGNIAPNLELGVVAVDINIALCRSRLVLTCFETRPCRAVFRFELTAFSV